MKQHYFLILKVFIACCLLDGNFVFAQAETDSINTNPYIEKFDDYFSARLSLSNGFQSFDVHDRNSNLRFKITPNQQIRSTATFMFRFIEIDLGYTPTFLKFNKDDDIKGKTKNFTFGTRFYLKKWMQNLQYMSTKGYYVEGRRLGLDDNVFFSDLKVVKIGGSTSYVFNPNYSFRATYTQNEWQKKSAGSFVPSVNYYYTKISNNDNSADHNIDIAAGPAYYYNLILYDHFLISAGVYGGVGYNSITTKYNDGTPNEKSSGISWQAQYRAAVGYNYDQFYTGANINFNSFYYNSGPGIKLADQQHYFEFYVGYRFKDAQKILKKFDEFIDVEKKRF